MTRFYKFIKGEANEPRSGNALRRVRFAVFGLGNTLYSKHYNTGSLPLPLLLFDRSNKRSNSHPIQI